MADDQAVGCHRSWPVSLSEEDRASYFGPVLVLSERRRALAAFLIVSGYVAASMKSGWSKARRRSVKVIAVMRPLKLNDHDLGPTLMAKLPNEPH